MFSLYESYFDLGIFFQSSNVYLWVKRSRGLVDGRILCQVFDKLMGSDIVR